MYTLGTATYTRQIYIPEQWCGENILSYAHVAGDSRTFNLELGCTEAAALRICIEYIKYIVESYSWCVVSNLNLQDFLQYMGEMFRHINVSPHTE